MRRAMSAWLMVAVAAIATLVTPVSAGAEVGTGADYVRTAYDGTIFEVTDDDVYPLTWDEYVSAGRPAWVPAVTRFQKVLSFPQVVAVTDFDRAGLTLETGISWAEYVAAGYPRVEVKQWGEGIAVHQWPTSPELFATDGTGSTIRLTYAQWRDAGFPSFQRRDNRGFVRLSWDTSGGIAYMCDIAAGRGGRLTYEQWIAAGAPSPQTVVRTSVDHVFKLAGSPDPTVWYYGPMTSGYQPYSLPRLMAPLRLTLAQWQAMGSPAPPSISTPSYEPFSCSLGSPTPDQ